MNDTCFTVQLFDIFLLQLIIIQYTFEKHIKKKKSSKVLLIFLTFIVHTVFVKVVVLKYKV